MTVSLFVGLLIGVAPILRPFVPAILLATMIVIATWLVHEWLLRQGLPNTFAAFILTAIAVAFIVVLAAILSPRLGRRQAGHQHRRGIATQM